jgi:hypothetical protein
MLIRSAGDGCASSTRPAALAAPSSSPEGGRPRRGGRIGDGGWGASAASGEEGRCGRCERTFGHAFDSLHVPQKLDVDAIHLGDR